MVYNLTIIPYYTVAKKHFFFLVDHAEDPVLSGCCMAFASAPRHVLFWPHRTRGASVRRECWENFWRNPWGKSG